MLAEAVADIQVSPRERQMNWRKRLGTNVPFRALRKELSVFR